MFNNSNYIVCIVIKLNILHGILCCVFHCGTATNCIAVLQ